MSALLSIADINKLTFDCRFVPQADKPVHTCEMKKRQQECISFVFSSSEQDG
jgi:hypothetical protein